MHLLIFSKTFEVLTSLFSLSLSLSPLHTSIYSIDPPIYFSMADLDRMSRMFSLVLSPKFYRGRTSIVISLFGIHFPTPTCILQCHPLPLSRSSVLSLIFLRSFYSTRFYLRLCLSYWSGSTHSRAVSYSWPLWQ